MQGWEIGGQSTLQRCFSALKHTPKRQNIPKNVSWGIKIFMCIYIFFWCFWETKQ